MVCYGIWIENKMYLLLLLITLPIDARSFIVCVQAQCAKETSLVWPCVSNMLDILRQNENEI